MPSLPPTSGDRLGFWGSFSRNQRLLMSACFETVQNSMAPQRQPNPPLCRRERHQEGDTDR